MIVSVVVVVVVFSSQIEKIFTASAIAHHFDNDVFFVKDVAPDAHTNTKNTNPPSRYDYN